MSADRPPIPGPEPDIAKLIRTLDRYGVRYVLVGGMASIAHGVDLATRDCDIVVDQDAVNLVALVDALHELNARERSATASADAMAADAAAGRVEPDTHPAEIQDGFVNVQTDAGPIDVLPHMLVGDNERVDYRALDRSAVHLRFIDTDVTVKVASIDHLIAAKETIDRPHDRAAVEQLRRIRRNSAR